MLLTIAHDMPDRIKTLRKHLMNLHQVKHFYYVTGEADFVMTVVCDTMEDYVAFTGAHFYEPYLKGFESIVVLREYAC